MSEIAELDPGPETASVTGTRELAFSHLRKALETESAVGKNYHVRSALQALIIEGESAPD